ncbi:RNA polymerase sigma-70 factor [Bacteroides sp.]|uniref:RNA polymerase sigma-70 factor n=1 Tax=Bacteroides sp. TaxID=29523 RepID=UPI00258E2A1E|nr:RNA polymerase sigma-70 factor [Bacteroides sp.]
MKTESNLIEELRAGVESAYASLYNEHYSILCVFAKQYVKDSYTAETIVSDVMFTIWCKRAEISIHSSLRNYLMQAVKNSCYNYLLKYKREQLFSQQIDGNTEDQIPQLSLYDNSPLTDILSKELDIKIKKAIEELPIKTREIFLMSRLQDLKYKEIADKTNLSIDSVKYHVKQALSALRESLGDYLVLVLALLKTFFK